MELDALVYAVIEDAGLRDALIASLTQAGLVVRGLASPEAFLAQCDPAWRGCLIVDLSSTGMSGREIQRELATLNITLPVIFITGHGDIETSVAVMRAGAVDFLEKPVSPELLLSRIEEALAQDRLAHKDDAETRIRRDLFSRLSRRELEVVARIVQGRSNKEIARDLSISFRTVEKYRATALIKLGVTNLTDLCTMGHRMWKDLLQEYFERTDVSDVARRPARPPDHDDR
jgi:FixJ family two-component response regulator